MNSDQLPMPDTSAPRSEYIRLLCELHALMAKGSEGTLEIRGLRDAMDFPGEQLSDAEIDQMHGLSADLYDLANIPPSPSAPARLKTSSPGLRLWNAYVEKNWDALLSELRAHKGQLAPECVTVLRAYAWAQLYEQAPLLAFLNAAAQLAMQGCADQLAHVTTDAAATEPRASNSPLALRELRDARNAVRASRALISLMPGTGSIDRRRP